MRDYTRAKREQGMPVFIRKYRANQNAWDIFRATRAMAGEAIAGVALDFGRSTFVAEFDQIKHLSELGIIDNDFHHATWYVASIAVARKIQGARIARMN